MRKGTGLEMYRSIVPVLLYISIVSTAPQESQDNTNVTYIKIQPLVDDNQTTEKETSRESRIENIPLTVPGNVTLENEFSRHIENVDFTTEVEPETTAFFTAEELTTTKIPVIVTKKPAPKRTGFKPNPRFISKLSYYNKVNSVSENLVDKLGKRTFKSRCRCEKIWNCPKLQITVPRCPDEYFLCCF